MKFNPFKDVTYHHHWKLMTIVTAAVFFGVVFALMKSWFLVAIVLGLALAILAVQWITIDPPEITDEDVHGGRRKASGQSNRDLPSQGAP